MISTVLFYSNIISPTSILLDWKKPSGHSYLDSLCFGQIYPGFAFFSSMTT